MRYLFFLFILINAIQIQAAEYNSGDKKVQMIELYSSEGCSSCPPADRWLAKLYKHPRLWKDFVPIEFHVDYWNRLGWIDPFSHNQFTSRQRQYSRLWRKSKVYTPGFILNGEEWELGSQRIPGASSVSAGVLKAQGDKNKYQVSYTPRTK
ncbi:MAG: DUF1223 domain-containing protein [Bdellovibrionales bacterium]|nr:DUF1223 domain-containing protein [Bdellovibrionales bacterium]